LPNRRIIYIEKKLAIVNLTSFQAK
jgi:hypothetical protein